MLHPIVVQMSPSPEQEPAIGERGRDVVVTAGAGTGKTRTLVARYLSLLALWNRPPRQSLGGDMTYSTGLALWNRSNDTAASIKTPYSTGLANVTTVTPSPPSPCSPSRCPTT